MQKEVPSRKKISILLSKLSDYTRPIAKFEQYTIPSELASEILFIATVKDDVRGRTVVDLGCGPGRIAIATKILGAHRTIGIDIDPKAIFVARKNTELARVKVEWVVGDISALTGRVDTVVMNPPFGTRTYHADSYFLEKATSLARVVYSIHKSSTRTFIEKTLAGKGWIIDLRFEASMVIPYSYDFHRKKTHNIQVDVIRTVPA